MKNKIQIIPAILAITEAEYQEKLKKIEACPELNKGWVQIDLTDNKFVQNQSIGADIVAKHKTSLKIEAHLMVEDPLNWIERLVQAKVLRIVFPIEVGNTNEVIKRVKMKNLETGIALNPQTPVAKIEPFLDTIDLVLLLSVQPGFSGQKFIPETLKRIRQLVKFRARNRFLIEIDGGINDQVAKTLVEAGADNLVIGSFLINGDITENLEKIWQSLCSPKSSNH